MHSCFGTWRFPSKLLISPNLTRVMLTLKICTSRSLDKKTKASFQRRWQNAKVIWISRKRLYIDSEFEKIFRIINSSVFKIDIFSCFHEDLATCVHNMLLNKMKDRKTSSHELLVFLPIAVWSMLYTFYSFCVPNLTAAFVCWRTKLPFFHLIGETAASVIVPLFREAKIYF